MIVMTDDILKATIVDLLKETYFDTYEMHDMLPHNKKSQKDVRKSVKVLLKHFLTEGDYKEWVEGVKHSKEAI